MKLDRIAAQSKLDIQSINRYVAHKRAEINRWEPAPYQRTEREDTRRGRNHQH